MVAAGRLCYARKSFVIPGGWESAIRSRATVRAASVAGFPGDRRCGRWEQRRRVRVALTASEASGGARRFAANALARAAVFARAAHELIARSRSDGILCRGSRGYALV